MTTDYVGHPALERGKVIQTATESASKGFCLACANEQDGVEPDAEDYECEVCGEEAVMGAEQILIHHG